jgi:sulfur carrier protein
MRASLFRSPSILVLLSLGLLLLLGPCCIAQTITIRVISASDGHPLEKQKAAVTLLYRNGEQRPSTYDANLSFETDVNGKVQFTVPEPVPGHLEARIIIDWGRWDCVCRVLATTEDVLRAGWMEFATNREKSPAPVKPTPGEIVFAVRPLSLWERLLYPLVKESTRAYSIAAMSETRAAASISVNGETRAAKPGATVIDLLGELGLSSGRVAIERNLEILPRDQWAETRVQPGDRYEIVQFVGGG